MAVQKIKTVFQFRRATAEEWLLNKDVKPAAGEPCFVVDKNILKIGDGTHTFEQLEPINGVKLEIAADDKSIILDDNVLKLMGFDDAPEGAYPQKDKDGKIKWVVPSTEVIDTLKSDVAGLKTSVDSIVTDVSTLTTNVSGLQTEVSDLKVIIGSDDSGSGTLLSRIEGLEKEVDTIINGLTPDDGKIDSLVELINYVETHGKKTAKIVSDITTLQDLVGSDPVADQITTAIANSGHMSKAEAVDTLLSKVEARAAYEKIKYEITDVPTGTLVDYREKEIRVMVPAGAQFVKQAVGAGGDSNNYYCTFKTYAPNDNVVGYIEHLNGKVDSEILTNFSVDQYGRRYQPTWLALANYDEATNKWSYYGEKSTVNKYIGYDYQIDWYDANGVVVESEKIRINLSNENCHSNIEPFYMANVVKSVSVNGTLLDMVDGKIDIAVNNVIKSSDEIEVAEDGSLRIKTISFDKIAQSPDVTIIMDGGSAV